MEDASLCTLLPTGPCIIAAAQYCCEGQSSFVRQAPPDETQTGLPTTRQARQASYEKGCNTGWHLEHGGLRVFDSSNLRAKPRTAAVATIPAQPRGYESWRHVRRHPWSPSVLRILRVHERSIASCRIALRKPQSRTELANRAIGSSASSPPEHYLA